MLYPEISIFPYTFHMEYADVYDPQKRGLRQFLLRNAENLVPTCTHFAFTNLLKKGSTLFIIKKCVSVRLEHMDFLSVMRHLICT
jgi:hypothetical protein